MTFHYKGDLHHDPHGNRKRTGDAVSGEEKPRSDRQVLQPGCGECGGRGDPPDREVQKGIEAIKGKNRQWFENSQIHGLEVNGPFPNGDQFIIHFTYDVTPKQSGKRMSMSEMGLYTVRDGKIAKEEFFYAM